MFANSSSKDYSLWKVMSAVTNVERVTYIFDSIDNPS